MYFLIGGDDLSGEYNTVWDKVKIKLHGDKVTDFHDKKTFHKEMDSLQNVSDRNDFNNWLCKLNIIIEKLDIKLKRQKIKKIKKMVRYDYLKKCVWHHLKNIKPVFISKMI